MDCKDCKMSKPEKSFDEKLYEKIHKLCMVNGCGELQVVKNIYNYILNAISLEKYKYSSCQNEEQEKGFKTAIKIIEEKLLK